MKILAIDIGTGTQDIMLYDTEKELENSTKLVLPSPHLYISQMIKNTKNNIYIDGEIMGGGKIKNTILEHMQEGYEVVMNSLSAKTIRDDINQVKELGIKVDDTPRPDWEKITLADIDLKKLTDFIKSYDMDFSFDKIAVAVQDHGYSKDMGDRDFRFEKIREKLKKPINPREFAFNSEIPDYYTRMNAVKRTLKKEGITNPLIMDTKFASIAGMCCEKTNVVIDIGNGHTTAASIEDGKIQGVFEHHTRNLTKNKLETYITKLSTGELTNEEIFNDHGHGAYVLNPLNEMENVIVTGPKRDLIKNCDLNWEYATPAGDVMMTGTVGLIKSVMGD